ncbi:hypothetical protein [Actinoplanes derwentensis]|uniref:Uncharacterized protein n=1 Tax=Actinoplanes derwentensis TaxID=113562 RepID=A0A1H2CU62_9ACTN|nr:hypothetical protein [Actinoplanes derwentensis]GID81815.1 hypothetical protein Ade03nite_07390 [Actinoplanes derwentensis]SDT73732.1 hypothetical protein SAMN04489716_6763 [Actinoplanes derwentensis]
MTGAEFEGVDFDLLADFVGGALDGTPDQERVATLVAGDPVWRASFEALAPAMAAVGGALEAFDPEPMPDDLADRLDTLLRAPAIAAEPREVPAPDVPAKVVDLDSRRRARRWAAPLTVAAAVLAFAGFGASWWVANQPMDNSNDTASSAAVAEGAAEAGLPFAVTSSGMDYTVATLTEVPMGSTMASGETGISAPDKTRATALKNSALGRLDDAAELMACVEAITTENSGGTITVEGVDYALFDGKPAVIVRFSAANGLWVWAVGPECGVPGAGADTVRKLPVR